MTCILYHTGLYPRNINKVLNVTPLVTLRETPAKDCFDINMSQITHALISNKKWGQKKMSQSNVDEFMLMNCSVATRFFFLLRARFAENRVGFK